MIKSVFYLLIKALNENFKYYWIKKNEILYNWLDKVRKEIPVAGNYDKTVIQDSVPDLKDSIIDVLETNNPQHIIQE